MMYCCDTVFMTCNLCHSKFSGYALGPSNQASRREMLMEPMICPSSPENRLCIKAFASSDSGSTPAIDSRMELSQLSTDRSARGGGPCGYRDDRLVCFADGWWNATYTSWGCATWRSRAGANQVLPGVSSNTGERRVANRIGRPDEPSQTQLRLEPHRTHRHPPPGSSAGTNWTPVCGIVAMDVALAAAIGAAPINDATAPATKKGVKLSFLMPSE